MLLAGNVGGNSKFTSRNVWPLAGIQNLLQETFDRWREFKVYFKNTSSWLRKIRVLEVNFWIPANSCKNSCLFSICYSCYHSLFKKSKLSWNSKDLAENELSVWDPCGNIFVQPMRMPASQKTRGCLCRAIPQQSYDQMQSFFSKKPHESYN